MRKVLFKKWIPGEYEGHLIKTGTNTWEAGFSGEGLFHCWGFGYEEFESGAGNYTYAIIELPDGTIEEVLPSNVKFITDNPESTNTKDKTEDSELSKIRSGQHPQFVWNDVKQRVYCRCGEHAVLFRKGYLCSSITAYPCKY